MSDKEQAIIKLREAVEAKIGNKPETNRDFENLSNTICDELHDRISPTTLKRIWGYLSEAVTPRHYTLNQLSRFVGYTDWDAFCATLKEHEVTKPSEPASLETTETTASSVTKKNNIGKILLALVAFLAIAALFFFSQRSSSDASSSDNPHILQKGQTFKTYDDFLPLFGITAQYNRHYQYVPGAEHIAVWSPQYQNPYYHNDGNPDSLMPTITEYYHPEDWPTDSASMAQLAEMNKKGYLTALKENQVRLCFMKNLVDSNFVFLGAYRVSTTLSDTTKVVWARVDDECDLDNISFLNNYRN